MLCRKCKTEIPDISAFCLACGAKQATSAAPRRRTRGNGMGTAWRRPSGKWRAEVTLGYDDKGKRIRRVKDGFNTKKEALEYLQELRNGSKKNARITLKQLYDKWFPTHRASKPTMDCYKAAMAHFRPVWGMTIQDIDIDDLQECLDECPAGKRTRQNMKAVCGLIYKYGIPRNHIPENLNLAPYLIVTGEAGGPLPAFSDEEVELIRNACGKIEYAEYIYSMIYTGFRISELLALDAKNYDRENKCIIGGAKTDAGTNRPVTISPKVLPVFERLTKGKSNGPIFGSSKSGARMTADNFRKDYFYAILEEAGIPSPQERRLTPHACRRTFATLMKGIEASDKDKLTLMGHTSTEMLRHYQGVRLEDLRKITDKL